MRDDEKITIVADGGSIELSPSSDYFWVDADGLGGSSADIYTSQKAARPGAKITGKHVIAKPITLYGKINDEVADYADARKMLLRTIRAGIEVTLVYECSDYTRSISGVIQTAPDPRLGIYSDFKITCFCGSPFWRGGVDKLVTHIASWEPNIIFPITIPEEGLAFAIQSASLLAHIVNDGDEELPLTIVITALAAVDNPSLINVVTQEQMIVETSMIEGDVITIETDDDLMTATLLRDGVETNIFNLVPEDAAWLKLAVGENYLRAGASNSDYVTIDLLCDDGLYDWV